MKKMNMNRNLVTSAVVAGLLGVSMVQAAPREKISIDAFGPALHRTYVDASAVQESGPGKRYINGTTVVFSNGPAKRYVKDNAGAADADSAENKE